MGPISMHLQKHRMQMPVQKLIKNLTKYSVEQRFKGGYFNERLNKLTHMWTQFKINDTKLHECHTLSILKILQRPSPRKTGENLEPKEQPLGNRSVIIEVPETASLKYEMEDCI